MSVEGRLTPKDAGLVLMVGKAQYTLAPAQSVRDKWEALGKLSPGERVRIEGSVVSEAPKPTKIAVTNFTALPAPGRTD